MRLLGPSCLRSWGPLAPAVTSPPGGWQAPWRLCVPFPPRGQAGAGYLARRGTRRARPASAFTLGAAGTRGISAWVRSERILARFTMLSGTSISSNSVVALPQLHILAALLCALTLRGGRGLQRGADRAGLVPRNARLRAAQLRRRGRTADWLPFPEIWLRCRRWCSAVAAGGAAPHSSPQRARTAVPLSRLRRAHLMPSAVPSPLGGARRWPTCASHCGPHLP